MADDEPMNEEVKLLRQRVAQLERERACAHEADRALRENEERYRTMVETSIHGIVVIAPAGDLVFANRRAFEIFGYDSIAELTKLTTDDFVAPEYRDKLAERRASVQPGRPKPLTLWEGVRKDGSRIWIESAVTAIDGHGPPSALIFLVDVTERKRLEAQFLQAQKMEAIGRLAAGVAHDFNNLLTVISGYGEMVRDTLEISDPLREAVEEICQASERAASLTRQLLALGRRSILEPRVIDLNLLLARDEKMLRRLVGEQIAFECQPCPGEARIRVDPVLMQQVILNLVVNARDAMPTGGGLMIRILPVEKTVPESLPEAGVAPGRYFMLAVQDNGSGMTSEVKSRIFEPFFTTKEPGKGSGLGLAAVYGIVKQLDGFVEVESEPGRGTTFRVYLPAIDSSTEPEGGGTTPAPGRARGSETILLVEDEDELRGFFQKVLRSSGFNVLTAADGPEAMQIAGALGVHVHLLVTDVIMPHMSGRRLAEIMREKMPSLKVLYLSGYTDDEVMRHGIREAEVAFLQKPFSGRVLVAKVREVLDAS